jgi:hypothetical protein
MSVVLINTYLLSGHTFNAIGVLGIARIKQPICSSYTQVIITHQKIENNKRMKKCFTNLKNGMWNVSCYECMLSGYYITLLSIKCTLTQPAPNMCLPR